MSTQQNPSSTDGNDQSSDEGPATRADTLQALVERSNRAKTPILKGFVQDPDRSKKSREAPLSVFVRNGDLRGLQALLLLHTTISSGEGDNGWAITLELATLARAFGTTETASPRTAPTAATKILTRLVARGLIERKRQGRARKITITLLRPDGSGLPYTRPGKNNADRFLQLDNRYWTEGWHAQLDLPATAMLLVALHEKPGFPLATEHMPAWYGFSADTAERGLRTLVDHGLLTVAKRKKKAPLAPSGYVWQNIYTLQGPFEQPPAASSSGASSSAAGATDTKKTVKKTSKKKTVKRRTITRNKRTSEAAP